MIEKIKKIFLNIIGCGIYISIFIYFLTPFLLFFNTDKEEERTEEINVQKDPRYYYNSKYRGSSGKYNYNYDVSGYDNDGNLVYGNINIEGKYGNGYIELDDGEELEIEAEWVDYGEIEATDDDGNIYYLEVY